MSVELALGEGHEHGKVRIPHHGCVRIYRGTDGKVYRMDDSGTFTPLTAEEALPYLISAIESLTLRSQR